MPPPPAELFASRIFLGPALRAQPDRRLVDLVRGGYDTAFEEIVRRYRKPLDRFAAAIVGGRSEDVTQDAFSKALSALRGSEAEIELRPWLYRIVRNTALNDLRDRAPAGVEIPETLPGGRSTAAEAEAREELRELMARLQALPEPQRAALVMRELEGLSHEEIAAALGVSGGAARQAIYRARAALREGFGLLLPLPALRIFAEHGAEMVKAGAATVLIAGTVGAGVAIKHHQTGNGNSNVAEAAPLVGAKHGGSRVANEPASSSSAANGNARNGVAGGEHRSHDDESGDESGDSSLGEGSRSGSSGPGPSGGAHLGGGSHHTGSSGPSPDSGSGDDDGSGDRHGGGGGGGDGGSSNSGSGSLDSNDDDLGGSSGPGGDDDGPSTVEDGGGGSSGPGGGEVASGPTSEPALAESDDGGSSGTSGDDGGSSSSSGPGSGETTTDSSGSNVSP